MISRASAFMMSLVISVLVSSVVVCLYDYSVVQSRQYTVSGDLHTDVNRSAILENADALAEQSIAIQNVATEIKKLSTGIGKLNDEVFEQHWQILDLYDENALFNVQGGDDQGLCQRPSHA